MWIYLGYYGYKFPFIRFHVWDPSLVSDTLHFKSKIGRNCWNSSNELDPSVHPKPPTWYRVSKLPSAPFPILISDRSFIQLVSIRIIARWTPVINLSKLSKNDIIITIFNHTVAFLSPLYSRRA